MTFCVKLQVALTRTHFKFGEEEMDYTTDHQMGFQYDPEKVSTLYTSQWLSRVFISFYVRL